MTTTNTTTLERMPVNEEFARVADSLAVDRAAAALKTRGFEVHVVPDGAAARELVLSMVPEGVEVGQGASMTLDEIGVTEAINSGNYVAIRPKTRGMDRATQMREIRKLTAAPDVQLNSVHALTEDGEMLITSATGSQLAPIAFGAGRVILVVGAQKVVPDLPAAFRRLEEYAVPLEDARAIVAYGSHTAMRKTLLFNGDFPGRTTVILIRETAGI